MLSHFSVKNYKCLADVSLPLTPIHVLIGQNDTGKTSLLEAIRASASLYTAFRPTTPRNVEGGGDYGGQLHIAFPGDWSGDELLCLSSVSKTMEFHLAATQSSDGPFRYSFQCDFSRHHDIKAHYSLNYPQRVDAQLFRFRPQVMARPSALKQHSEYRFCADGFGLPSLLAEIVDFDIERFSAIQNLFARYFPRFRRIRLENSAGWSRTERGGNEVEQYGDTLSKQVWLVTSNGEIRLQQASEGAILLLGFLALMHSPKPPDVLLIEEPENGIHPKRLIEVAKLLRQFVEREENAPQIIMTTHSPYLLSQFQPEEVTLMRRQPDGSAKAFPLRDAPHIRERMGDEFYLGELWYNLDEEELLK